MLGKDVSKSYPVGIVGEINYQAAIRCCSVGDTVRIMHEPDNPFDRDALAVVTDDGDTLGYISTENWLQSAVHDDHRGCVAKIMEVRSAGDGLLAVVLEVSTTGHPIETRPYDPVRRSQVLAQPKGCLALLWRL